MRTAQHSDVEHIDSIMQGNYPLYGTMNTVYPHAGTCIIAVYAVSSAIINKTIISLQSFCLSKIPIRTLHLR